MPRILLAAPNTMGGGNARILSGGGNQAPTQQPQDQNLGDVAAQNIKEGVTKIGGSIATGASKYQQGVSEANQSKTLGGAFKGEMKATGGLLESGLGTASGAINTALSGVNAITKKLADTFTPALRQQNPELAKVYDAIAPKLQNWATKHPELSTDLSDIANVLLTAAGVKGGASVAEKSLTEDALSGAKKDITSIPGKIKTAAEDKAVSSEKKLWSKVGTDAKTSNSKAAKVYSKAKSFGNNIEDTLTNNKIKYSNHIEDGKFNTQDTAETLRDKSGETSNKLLRPTLEARDAYTPKTPVKDLFTNAKKELESNKDLTPGAREKAIVDLKSEQRALERKHPNGMSLVDMHDNKITYSKNAGHKPFGSDADNLHSQMNDSVATAMKKAVEKGAPDLPVEEFNKELTKNYQAADYLSELHGKNVPKGFGSFIAKKVAQGAGLAVGAKTGGGILADMLGYTTGGAIEKQFENFSNPLKSMILNNLKTSDVAVYNKLTKYIGEQENKRLTTLALPAKGKSGAPMITPAPTTFEKAATKINRQPIEQQKLLTAGKPEPKAIPLGAPKPEGAKMIPAEKGLPTRNPKTGQMQTTYKGSITDATMKEVPKENVAKEVKVENAPKGNYMNIGMDVKGGTNLTESQIQKALKKYGITIQESKIHQSGTEPTFVVKTSRALSDKEMYNLSLELKQEAIPQLSNGIGKNHGGKNMDWGDFNPEYFMGLDGKTLK